MQGKITKASVDALAHGEFLADTEVKGFVVRRLPSGVEIASDFKILIRRGLVLCPRGAGLAHERLAWWSVTRDGALALHLPLAMIANVF